MASLSLACLVAAVETRVLLASSLGMEVVWVR